MRERFGVDVQAMHGDDGIVLRLPDLDLGGEVGVNADAGSATIGAELTQELLDLILPAENRRLVTAQSAVPRCSPPGSECAARLCCCPAVGGAVGPLAATPTRLAVVGSPAATRLPDRLGGRPRMRPGRV
jgi:hypothetical protein